MSESQLLIPVEMDKEEVANLFENYNLNSAAVVDKNNKLVGMIMNDDVLTVLKEEAEEDALRLAGVGDEEITDGVVKKTKRRFLDESATLFLSRTVLQGTTLVLYFFSNSFFTKYSC